MLISNARVVIRVCVANYLEFTKDMYRKIPFIGRPRL